MSPRLRRILLAFLGLFLILCITVASVGFYLPRRSFPHSNGEVRLAGLNAPVDIYRDAYGIPHIYASTPHDLFFAQGYVHAQDRFWQMDFWRHIGSGRLSEMFGESQLDTDKFLRTLGWARVAQCEIEAMDSESLGILQAYADGVNAYLSERNGSALSLEYAVLSLVTSGYQPEPWQVLHTLTYAKMMAWDLGGNMDAEIRRAILAQSLAPDRLAEIYPSYPEDSPIVVSGIEAGDHTQGLHPELDDLPGLLSLLTSVSQKSSNLNDLLGSGFEGIGSNNWVVSGDLTKSGKPLLANDPHLGVQMPSIWYENGLHCFPKSSECPFEVVGFTFASAPGVVVGHNGRIAWGVTNLGPDVQDLYVERINPGNRYQYEFNGQWHDMDVVRETIQVASGEPVEIEVRYTRNGPIISDVYGPLENFIEESGLEQADEQYGLALRWTALDLSFTFRSVIQYNQAQNWNEFRQALREFDVPSQNFVYADIDGNIGYQMPGKIPMRASGDGSLPVPGWTEDYDWDGFIPFDDLPTIYNPPHGYIVTANNAVVGPEYPHFLSQDWDRGFRARRIVNMIDGVPGLFTIETFQKMQGDNYNLNAEVLTPLILEISMDDDRLEQAQALLREWDFQAQMDSAPAALFEVFWKHLLALTYTNKLPENFPATGGSTWVEITRRLVGQPENPWWNNPNTSIAETRDHTFRQAFEAAVDELESLQGRDPFRWNWGGLHTVTFSNPTLGRSGPAPIRALFNRGPFPSSGGSITVNATGWSAASQSYEVRSVPSFRMIVDLSDVSNSLATNTTGQSGHAYHPHYIDQAEDWRMIGYHSILWERETIEAAAASRLRLAP
jgi:penicillin G amidase